MANFEVWLGVGKKLPPAANWWFSSEALRYSWFTQSAFLRKIYQEPIKILTQNLKTLQYLQKMHNLDFYSIQYDEKFIFQKSEELIQ